MSSDPTNLQANEQVGQLLQVNGLDYRIPPSLSVVVSRQTARYASNAVSHREKQPVSFVFSSGSQFIDGRNSYIKFTVTAELPLADTTTTVTTGNWYTSFNDPGVDPAVTQPNTKANPGVCSFWNRFRLTHASGTPMDELPNHMNKLMYMKCMYGTNNDWKQAVGSLTEIGHSTDELKDSAADTVIPLNNFHDGYTGALKFATTSVSKEYILPLSLVSDFFDQPQLIPPFLIAGARLDLWTEDVINVFVTNGLDDNHPTDFVITDASLNIEQYQLTDAIARQIASISSQQGLEFPYESWVHTDKITNGANVNFTAQVTRALSRANKIMMHSSVQKPLLADRKKLVHAATVPFTKHTSLFNIQAQLGGEYLPIQKIDTEAEAYEHALIAWNKYHSLTGTNIQYLNDWKYGGVAAPALTLEGSATLTQSGAALSAQRVLLVNYVRDFTVDLGNLQHVLFTSYVRLATSFLDSVIVRS